MKATHVISFRFTDAELEALKAQGKEGESHNTIAQRLLRDLLDNSRDNQEVADVIALIDAKIQPLKEDVAALRTQLLEKQAA